MPVQPTPNPLHLGNGREGALPVSWTPSLLAQLKHSSLPLWWVIAIKNVSGLSVAVRLPFSGCLMAITHTRTHLHPFQQQQHPRLQMTFTRLTKRKPCRSDLFFAFDVHLTFRHCLSVSFSANVMFLLSKKSCLRKDRPFCYLLYPVEYFFKFFKKEEEKTVSQPWSLD